LQRRKTTTLGAFALFFAITGTPAIAEDSALKSRPFLLLKLDGAYVKWGDPVLGTGAAVRYAFVGKDTRMSAQAGPIFLHFAAGNMPPLPTPLSPGREGI
jgi:hypothetical protein